MINMAYCCLILLGKVIQKLVFGKLRVIENQVRFKATRNKSETVTGILTDIKLHYVVFTLSRIRFYWSRNRSRGV